jgi:hypothetical protein
MSDSKTHTHTKGVDEVSPPVLVVPPPAHGQASTKPQRNGSPAPARKPLFGS